MVLDAILDQSRILTQIVSIVSVDMLQGDFQHVIAFLGAYAQHPLRNWRIRVIVGVRRVNLPNRARGCHPIQWFVRSEF